MLSREKSITKKVSIIEDDDQVRHILEEYLSSQTSLECLFTANSMEQFFEIMESQATPDIILMDIGLPGMDGIEGLKLIKSKYPYIEIIMLTVYHDPDKIFKSLCAGASGYLLKNTPLEEIVEGINTLGKGEAPMSPQIARRVIEYFHNSAANLKTGDDYALLSEREKQVVEGIVDGLSYKMLADKLSISIDTIRFHIKNIYRKLQINCKAELITRSVKRLL